MRLLTLLALLSLATGAAAQTADSANDGRVTERPERAPLAAVEDLEPAVDVGATRIAAGPRPAASPRPAEPLPAAASAEARPQAAAAPRPGNAQVMDTLDLGTTSITGNQELPKVLYIVPWKKSDLGDLVGRPVNTLLDEVLAPVDPEVFERHLDYYETLYGDSEEE
jgi:hypothetical protein